MNSRLVRLTSMVVALCALVAGLGSPARAVDPITMEVASPFMLSPKPLNIAVRAGRWLPLAVTLSNTGDAVQGRITVRVVAQSDDRAPNSESYTEVDLPANASRKRIWLYARIERDDANQVEVVFQGRGFKALKTTAAMVIKEPQTRLVLTVSDVDERLNFLGQLKGPGLEVDEEKLPDMGSPPSPNSVGLVETTGVPHDLVPSRWIGLEAFDLVVLHDFPHTSLTPAQLAALRGYVAGGGTLLAFGGTDWQRLAKSPLSDMWPVTPASSNVATNDEVARLVRHCLGDKQLSAGERLAGAPVVLTRGALRPDAVAVDIGGSSAGEPLMARRNLGAGHVALLAFDPTRPPFMGWEGSTGLWRTVFALAPRAPRMETADNSLNEQNYGYSSRNPNAYSAPYMDLRTGADAPLTSQLLQVLASARQLKTPPVSFIAWFLALYVFFLVPVNYCVLRHFDKRELAWVTIPVIVVLFSVMSYAAALRIKGNSILMREVNLVQGSQDSGVARADAMLWLFSPRKTSYDVSSADPQLALGDYLDAQRSSSAVGTLHEPDENKPFTLEGAAINMWDSRTFVASSVVNIGRGISLGEKNGKTFVTNNTERDLYGAALVSNGSYYPIGELKQGGTAAAATLSVEALTGGAGGTPPHIVESIISQPGIQNILPVDERDNFKNIARALVQNAISSKYAGRRNAPLFVAWGAAPVAPLTIGYDDARSRSLTFFVIRLNRAVPIRVDLSVPDVKMGAAGGIGGGVPGGGTNFVRPGVGLRRGGGTAPAKGIN